MTKVTIRNNFTGCVMTIDASKPLTASRLKTLRGKMRADACMSADDLGGRGKQDDQEAYDALLARAEQVAMTGRVA